MANENFIDKAIGFISPKAGLFRLKARFAADQIRSYEAANNSQRTQKWKSPSTSSNTEIGRSGRKLRNLSREMVRNNVYAGKAVTGIAANVVGSGIRPSIKSKSKQSEAKIKELWENWADESQNIDFDKNQNFYGLQYLIMKAVAESGEVLVRRVRRRRGDVPFQLQVLEIDHLDDSKDGIKTDGGGYVQMGIEFNRSGERVAYWIYKDHPGDNKIWKSLESVRVPAKEIQHIFFSERPGQLRGVPFGVASFFKLKDFEEYEDAQLVRQKIAACFSVFISSDTDPLPGSRNEDGAGPLERVEPGIIEYLAPGEKVEFGDPPATEGYDMYARKTLQGIAAGYGVTYEMLTNDLSNVNFSSGRMGWIEFGRNVTQWQNQIIIERFCKGVWDWFIDSLKITGEFTSDLTTTWTPPRREMIDPLKEAKGLSEMIRSGLNSWSGTVRELGRDPLIVLKEMETDIQMFDKVGLKLSSDARHDPNRSTDEEEDFPSDDKKKKGS